MTGFIVGLVLGTIFGAFMGLLIMCCLIMAGDK